MIRRSTSRPTTPTSLGYAAQKALSELKAVDRLSLEAYRLRKNYWLSIIHDHLKAGVNELKQEFQPLTVGVTSVRAIKRSYIREGVGNRFIEAYHILALALRHGKGTKKEINSLRIFVRRLQEEFHYHRLA